MLIDFVCVCVKYINIDGRRIFIIPNYQLNSFVNKWLSLNPKVGYAENPYLQLNQIYAISVGAIHLSCVSISSATPSTGELLN